MNKRRRYKAKGKRHVAAIRAQFDALGVLVTSICLQNMRCFKQIVDRTHKLPTRCRHHESAQGRVLTR